MQPSIRRISRPLDVRVLLSKTIYCKVGYGLIFFIDFQFVNYNLYAYSILKQRVIEQIPLGLENIYLAYALVTLI